jgi:hypothetical protein
MFDLFRPFTALPAYGMAALMVLLLYAVQLEARFGRKAQAIFAGLSRPQQHADCVVVFCDPGAWVCPGDEGALIP